MPTLPKNVDHRPELWRGRLIDVISTMLDDGIRNAAVRAEEQVRKEAELRLDRRSSQFSFPCEVDQDRGQRRQQILDKWGNHRGYP